MNNNNTFRIPPQTHSSRLSFYHSFFHHDAKKQKEVKNGRAVWDGGEEHL